MNPQELYYARTEVREEVEQIYQALEIDLKIFANRIKALPNDAVTSCPSKIRECWGIWMGIRRQAVRLQSEMGPGGTAKSFFLCVRVRDAEMGTSH